LSQIPTRLTELIAILGILLVFSYTLLFAEARSDLFTLLGVFAIAAYRVLPSTNRILMAVVSIKTHLYTLDLVESRQIWPDYLPAAPSHRLPFEQGIRFEGVSYRFPDSVTPVLDQVTLEVKKGEAVGIIGESGSGKTTLMRILLRLYHETGGTVYVDQTPLRDDNREAWLAHIGYVQQHIFIQDGTVRENIAFGVSPEAISDEAVWQAVQLAGLQAFVTALPQGLDTPLGEFGNRLSGGQRQRVAIARALYRQADILVFDEATSALDAETEQMITASIRELAAAGKTLFIIAHRLTTLEGCSRIHELAQGVIVKTYDYDTLLREKLGLVREASPASSSLA
jgi:ABC-type multidrug transport system fused ATPase/permease subunit